MNGLSSFSHRRLLAPAGEQGGGGDLEGRDKLVLRVRQIAGEVAVLKERLAALPPELEAAEADRVEALLADKRQAEWHLEQLDRGEELDWDSLEPALEDLWRSLEQGVADLKAAVSQREAEAGS